MQNKNNKTKQLLIIGGMAVLGTVLFPQQSFATSIQADFGIGESVYLNVDGVDARDWAGSIKIDIDGSHRIALCVDLFTSMNVNETYGTNLGPPGQINNGGRVAWLLNNELPLLNTAAELAGLQLAIWDIVHDNGNGFYTGRIQAATQHLTDAIALNEAKSLIALSAGKSATDGTVYFNYNLSSNLKVQTLMSGGASVPEPASFVMIGLGGLTGLWLKLRRK